MTACAVSGLLLLALALANLPQKMFDCTPFSVKNAMPIGLGMYLSLAGLLKLGIVAPDADTGLSTGPLSAASVAGLGGVLLMVYLEHLNSRWKFLLPICTVATAGWVLGLAPWPSSIVAGVSPAPPSLSFDVVDTWIFGPVGVFFLVSLPFSPVLTAVPLFASSPVLIVLGAQVAALVVIALFDIAGIMFACCGIANIVDERGGIPGAYWVFVAAGVGSLVSAALSCTPVIALGESFAGVLAGGRTGLTAALMGVFFLVSLPFSPVLTAVPLFASSPVLIVLGAQLLALLPASVSRGMLDFDDLIHGFPSFCTISMMPFLFGIEKGIAAGLLAWGCLQALDAAWRSAIRLAECFSATTAPKSAEFERINHEEDGSEGMPPRRHSFTTQGMPPRQNSFTTSPAPGAYPSPYLFRREASMGVLAEESS